MAVRIWRECQLVVPWSDPHEDIGRQRQRSPELFLTFVLEVHIVAAVMAGCESHRGWINYLTVTRERNPLC
jgi:hypothetical protein